MAGSSNEEEENYWPGFVDALTTMTMVLTFILMVLGIVVFSLSQTVNRAHLEAIADAVNMKSDPKSNPTELKDAIIARIATLAQAGPPLKDIPKERNLGIMATSADKPTELAESTAVLQPKSDSVPAENQNSGPAQVALAEPAAVPFARPTNGGVRNEVKQPSGERNSSDRPEAGGPETKVQPQIDPAAPSALPVAPRPETPVEGKTVLTPSEKTVESKTIPATPAGQQAASPDKPVELKEAESLVRTPPAAPQQASASEPVKTALTDPPPPKVDQHEQVAETRHEQPPVPNSAPAASQPSPAPQVAGVEDVGSKIMNADTRAAQAPAVPPPVAPEPTARPESAATAAVDVSLPAKPVADTQVQTAVLQPTKRVDPLVQEGELIESTKEPVFVPRTLGAKVTSDGSFITVKFISQSTSLSADEQTQVRTALRDERALAARSVEILAIAGIATSDLTEERRRAYFRMMSLRNELISSGISSNKIKLLVRDSKNPDDFNVVRISAR